MLTENQTQPKTQLKGEYIGEIKESVHKGQHSNCKRLSFVDYLPIVKTRNPDRRLRARMSIVGSGRRESVLFCLFSFNFIFRLFQL